MCQNKKSFATGQEGVVLDCVAFPDPQKTLWCDDNPALSCSFFTISRSYFQSLPCSRPGLAKLYAGGDRRTCRFQPSGSLVFGEPNLTVPQQLQQESLDMHASAAASQRWTWLLAMAQPTVYSSQTMELWETGAFFFRFGSMPAVGRSSSASS